MTHYLSQKEIICTIFRLERILDNVLFQKLQDFESKIHKYVRRKCIMYPLLFTFRSKKSNELVINTFDFMFY